MPTILRLHGWRFFFYAHEGHEPIHIHARKAEMECKFWLDLGNHTIRESFSCNMAPKDYRRVRQIISEHFDYIVAEWRRMHGGN